MQEFGLGNSSSELDPTEEQLVRISTDRGAYGQTRAAVVAVAGEIDLSTLDRFRGGLAAGSNQLGSGEVLVIDLTEVRFIDSTGLQALVEAADAMQAACAIAPRGRSLSAGDPSAEDTGLAESLALFDTVEQALRLPA